MEKKDGGVRLKGGAEKLEGGGGVEKGEEVHHQHHCYCPCCSPTSSYYDASIFNFPRLDVNTELHPTALSDCTQRAAMRRLHAVPAPQVGGNKY